MITTVERLPDCKATMHVQIPAERVTKERAEVIKTFSKQAKIPGFRPGKVPAAVIEKRFQKQIDAEMEDRMVKAGLQEGIDQEELKVISVTNVTEQTQNVDGSFSFLVEMTTAPEVTLPDYSSIPVKAPPSEVTEDQIAKALDELRERFAEFEDLERPIAMGDFAVLDYHGTVDGKRVGEVAPTANAQIAQNKGFWIKVADESFFPGFCDQLVGAAKDEKKEVTIKVPDDYPVQELVGKDIVYDVTVTGVKEQILPEVNDEFANKLIEGKNLEELREVMKTDMAADRERRIEDLIRNQIVDYLNGNSDFELPADIVREETQSRVNSIVEDNAKRGIGDDDIQKHQDEIIESASQQAQISVKASFILQKIAEEEKIEVGQEQMLSHISQMAAQQGTPAKKFIKELQKNRQIGQIHNSLLISRTLDFLRQNASVEVVEPEQEAAE